MKKKITLGKMFCRFAKTEDVNANLFQKTHGLMGF